MLLTHLQRGWRCGVFAAARVVWIFCEKLNFRQKNAQIHVFFYQVAVLADRISPTEASASKQRPRQWLGVASCAFHNSWHYCVPPFNRWPITTPTALHKKNNEHVCIINVGVSIAIRVGHADVSADAHQMCIDAHWCASSAYWTKRMFPFLTHKLPFIPVFQILGLGAPVDQYKLCRICRSVIVLCQWSKGIYYYIFLELQCQIKVRIGQV